MNNRNRNPWLSSKWGRGQLIYQRERVHKLSGLIKAVKEVVDKTKEKKMPIIRVTVLCKKDLTDRFE